MTQPKKGYQQNTNYSMHFKKFWERIGDAMKFTLCMRCDGTGGSDSPCPTCFGTGEENDLQQVQD